MTTTTSPAPPATGHRPASYLSPEGIRFRCASRRRYALCKTYGGGTVRVLGRLDDPAQLQKAQGRMTWRDGTFVLNLATGAIL